MGKPGWGNKENLKMWPKGQSGNPNGRPKTRIIRELARKLAEEKSPSGRQTIAEELVQILIKFARKGSLGHLQQFLQLIESDIPGAGWGQDAKLDADAIAKLATKLCRPVSTKSAS